MMASPVCQRCGAELTESTSRGLCPNCLLRDGLADTGEVPAEDGGQTTEDRRRRTDDGVLQSPVAADPSSLVPRPLRLPLDFGDYALLEQIGRGGMGIVYRARQKSLDRIVALKMLLFGSQASPEFAKRFRAEAVLAAGLQHPNIVAIHEVGVHDRQQFFAMDYVAGPSLAQIVGQQPLPAQRAASYLKTIAQAIHYAHERGILHRDLKPSNVLIDSQDQPRITDFGLAKRFEGDSQVTLTGQVLGSPNYIPPEQALGKRGKVSRQSDVYALGAMLYHLVTGRPPFQGETITDTLHQVLNAEPVAPRSLNPRLPRDLETICLKCLEREVPRRYPTAQELADDLGRFLGEKPIQARPLGTVGKAWKWCRRRPALAGVSAALALTFVLGLAGVLWQWQRARQNAQAELRQRKRAETGEYAADMHLAQLALADNNRALAISLLDKYRPAGKSEIRNPKSEIDLRGWEWRYLWQLCQGDESFTLHRYPSPIRALTVSKDGKLLAVATWDQVELWNLITQRPMTGLPFGTKALAFSPSNNLLAVGARDAGGQPGVDFWDLNSGKVTQRVSHEGQVTSLAFSPDGKLLATFDDRGNVVVQEWASHRFLTNFSVALSRYRGAGVFAFSPEGNRLAFGEDYGPVRLLDLRTGTSMRIQTQASAGVTALAFSPNSDLLAAGFGYFSGTIRLLDTSSGEPRGQLTNHTGDINGLVFTPDGQHLISASADWTIRQWSVADQAEVRRFWSSREELTTFAMLPDGRMVTGGSEGSVCFWDSNSNNRPLVYANWAVSLGFDALAVADAPTFARETMGPAARRFGVAFTPDSRSFITTHPDGSLALWDAGSVRVTENLTALGSNHWGLALSPDGRWLAAGKTSGELTIWDWTNRRAVTNFTVPCEWFGRLRFSRSGDFLLSSVFDNDSVGSARIWRTDPWQEETPAAIRSGNVWSLDLSLGDRILAAGDINGVVQLFGFPSGEHRASFTNSSQSTVSGVLFSPDTRRLISTDLDGSARLWDVSTGREVAAPLRGHLGLIGAAALTPDSRRLATGGESPRDAVKLWDLVAHRELLTLPGEGGYFCDVVSSLDGNTLVATAMSGTANLWRAPSWAEIDAAEHRQKPQ